jgi:thymidine phosphorylase
MQAQGGFREPEFAIYKEDVIAEKSGVVTEIDNRRLAKLQNWLVHHTIVKQELLKTPLNTKVQKEICCILYSETKGELKY